MGMKKIYNCDICRDEMDRNKLIGLNFIDNKQFKFDKPTSTDGVHICIQCLVQIKDQANEERHKDFF